MCRSLSRAPECGIHGDPLVYSRAGIHREKAEASQKLQDKFCEGKPDEFAPDALRCPWRGAISVEGASGWELAQLQNLPRRGQAPCTKLTPGYDSKGGRASAWTSSSLLGARHKRPRSSLSL